MLMVCMPSVCVFMHSVYVSVQFVRAACICVHAVSVCLHAVSVCLHAVSVCLHAVNVCLHAGMDDFDDLGPSVVFASPGMLQNGLSRELFELWCVNKKNGTCVCMCVCVCMCMCVCVGVIIPGYSVEGTLAKEICNEPDEIISMAGQSMPLSMSVHYVCVCACLCVCVYVYVCAHVCVCACLCVCECVFCCVGYFQCPRGLRRNTRVHSEPNAKARCMCVCVCFKCMHALSMRVCLCIRACVVYESKPYL